MDRSIVQKVINGAKITLRISWDIKVVLYHELLKSDQTITGNLYRTQLIHLVRAVAERRPETKQ